jgi:hypothetical protein
VWSLIDELERFKKYRSHLMAAQQRRPAQIH